MLKLLALLFFCASTLTGSAQNQWHYMPNNGLQKGSKLADTIYRIEDIYFTNANTGFAVTLKNRLLKTIDSGNNWLIKNDTADIAEFRSIEFLDDDSTGIAGTLNPTGKIFRSVDAGETWINISSSITDTLTNGSKRICGLAHYGDNFYGVGWWGSDVARFYKSTDKGASWQTIYIDTNLATALVDAWFISKDTGFVTGRRNNAVSPQASVILKTTDGGISWAEVFSDTVFAGWVWKIQFVNKDVAVGAIQGWFSRDSINMVYSEDGGESWKIIAVGNEIDKGRSTQACGFATPAKGWVGGYYDGIFETTDSGKTWRYEQFGRNCNRIFVIDSTLVYAGGHMPYIYKYEPVSIQQVHSSNAELDKLYPISPNPSNILVHIEFELSAETNVVLNVVNVENRTVYKVANTRLFKGKHMYTWDGSNEPAGHYFVWLGTDSMPHTQKFVLLK